MLIVQRELDEAAVEQFCFQAAYTWGHRNYQKSSKEIETQEQENHHF